MGFELSFQGQVEMRKAARRPVFQAEKYSKFFSSYTHSSAMFCITLQGRLSLPYCPTELTGVHRPEVKTPALKLMKLQYCVVVVPHRIPFFCD